MRQYVRVLVGSGAVIMTISFASEVVRAHEPHECPPLYPDSPTMEGHVEHSDLVSSSYHLDEIREVGRELFTVQFNLCDGQGRPATTGTGAKRVPDEPAFIRTSSPDANACASCHNAPETGGAGGFVANVFVSSQAEDPVEPSVEFGNERNTLGMFGAGPIDMLAREMSRDLRAQAVGLSDGAHTLFTKGVAFDVTVAGGVVVSSRGVDMDLIVKPFHQAGVVRSTREFTVNAFNHHHGMQAEERFDFVVGQDWDEDGIVRELTVGDVTAATIFQAALSVPGRVLPSDPTDRLEVDRGEQLFDEVGCTSCHIPALRLDSRDYVEPYSLNPPGTFSDDSQAVTFDMTKQGQIPRLEATPGGGAIVRAYTDLKRHNLCDAESDPDPIRFFCNEELAQGRPTQDGRPGEEFFLTRKLWDVGNSAPYGHRGDLTTITEAILAHGGEARPERDLFATMPVLDQAAVVSFLKTLQVLPPNSPRVIVEASPRM